MNEHASSLSAPDHVRAVGAKKPWQTPTICLLEAEETEAMAGRGAEATMTYTICPGGSVFSVSNGNCASGAS
ncbi:MAG: hypothetical protein RLZZ15_1089 [Verrucomicrobiota bacterium]|jgi:hypothetical protein